MTTSSLRPLIVCAAGLMMLWPLADAEAGDLPAEALAEIPLSAAVVNWGGLYSWVESGYQSLDFAHYNATAPAQMLSPTWAPLRSTDLAPSGYGIRGAIGVIIPGSQDVRVQLTTSYVAAAAVEGGNTSPAMPALGCGALSSCLAATSPVTGYRSWQVELRAATDYDLGRASFTPSVSLFGKSAVGEQPIFEGSVQSRWTDMGARLGLDSFFSLAPHAMLGLRGSLAAASRSVTFASDLYALPAFDIPEAASSASASRGVMLANVEASVIWKPAVWQTFKAYVGLQIDSQSPIAPDVLASPGAPIAFGYLQTVYVGGSLKVSFEGAAARGR